MGRSPSTSGGRKRFGNRRLWQGCKPEAHPAQFCDGKPKLTRIHVCELLFVQRAVSFLQRHPIFCLFLLTPGIPEYLSSSSPLNALVLNPAQFAFQLAANTALYLPGALLVREAMVRWRKGWGSVLLLGGAYGILEEGIALSTLYNPNAGPVGQLGFYGHWLGVSWVWAAGILLVHAVYSIALPIMLLGLALPQTKGRSLVGRRGLGTAICVLGADVVGLSALITFGMHFWMGWPVFAGSWLAMAALVLAAKKAPAALIGSTTAEPKVGPVVSFVMGLAFFPFLLFPEQIPKAANLPPFVSIISMYVLEGLLLLLIAHTVGSRGNERVLIGLALGVLVPICVLGVAAELRLPFTLGGDLLMVWFLRRLWRKEAPGQGIAQPIPV